MAVTNTTSSSSTTSNNQTVSSGFGEVTSYSDRKKTREKWGLSRLNTDQMGFEKTDAGADSTSPSSESAQATLEASIKPANKKYKPFEIPEGRQWRTGNE